MIKKGTMLIPKRIIGVIFGAVAFGLLFFPDKVQNYLVQYRPILAIALGLVFAFGSYLLIISGRRQ